MEGLRLGARSTGSEHLHQHSTVTHQGQPAKAPRGTPNQIVVTRGTFILPRGGGDRMPKGIDEAEGGLKIIFAKIVLPKAAKVVLLEDSEMRIEWFKKRCPDLKVFTTVEDFTAYFSGKGVMCDFIFLDHDLGTEKTGYDAAKWMADHFGRGGKSTLVHSWNKEGAARMVEVMGGSLSIPFGDFELEVEQ